MIQMIRNGDTGIEGYSYAEWLGEERHRAAWDTTPSEPTGYLVTQLISLLIRAVEYDTAGDDDLRATKQEVRRYRKAKTQERGG